VSADVRLSEREGETGGDGRPSALRWSGDVSDVLCVFCSAVDKVSLSEDGTGVVLRSEMVGRGGFAGMIVVDPQTR
jgi:hypothetical protein